MPIRVQCECGSRLDAPDSLAGRQAVCGACGRVLQIVAQPAAVTKNAPAPQDDEDDDFAENSRLPRRVARQRTKVFEQRGSVADVDQPRRKKRRVPSDVAPVKKSTPKGGGSIVDVWVRGLSFPFRREALITLAVLGMIFGPIFGGISSAPELIFAGMLGPKTMAAMFLIGTVILGYFCYFLFQTLRSAAMNELDLPVATEFDWEEIFIDLWLMVGGTAVVFAPLWITRSVAWFLEFEIPPVVTWTMFAVLCIFWPMGVTSSALHTSALAANHWTVLRAILKIPMHYAMTLFVIALLFATVYGIDYLMPDSFVTAIISWFLNFTAITSCMYLIGNLYFHNRRRIGWFGELQRQY
jgi:hypothetical protein